MNSENKESMKPISWLPIRLPICEIRSIWEREDDLERLPKQTRFAFFKGTINYTFGQCSFLSPNKHTAHHSDGHKWQCGPRISIKRVLGWLPSWGCGGPRVCSWSYTYTAYHFPLEKCIYLRWLGVFGVTTERERVLMAPAAHPWHHSLLPGPSLHSYSTLSPRQSHFLLYSAVGLGPNDLC